MYTLTLTQAERSAIDWVGYRYGNGTDLYRLLWVHSSQSPEVDWDYNGDITFTIPEDAAWNIAEIREEEEGWPCFGPLLCDKLDTLVDQYKHPGDDVCDICYRSNVNADRTTYCGKTLGIECGCNDKHSDGVCNDINCEMCKKN
jgi:hypothetical protein